MTRADKEEFQSEMRSRLRVKPDDVLGYLAQLLAIVVEPDVYGPARKDAEYSFQKLWQEMEACKRALWILALDPPHLRQCSVDRRELECILHAHALALEDIDSVQNFGTAQKRNVLPKNAIKAVRKAIQALKHSAPSTPVLSKSAQRMYEHLLALQRTSKTQGTLLTPQTYDNIEADLGMARITIRKGKDELLKAGLIKTGKNGRGLLPIVRTN